MKFKNVAEAFSYYKDHGVEDIEKGAGDRVMVNTDPSADVELNIELDD